MDGVELMKLRGAQARLAWLAAFLVGVAQPSEARADAPALEKASAEALFQDAMKLMKEKHYDEACPKLAESQRLDPAVGTQFRLAQCYESAGQTASAWANYLEVADAAKAAGQADRERVARERASSVETRLPRLSIIVSSPELPGIEVRRGDLVVGRAQWGAMIPVDPGTYAFTASAPHRVPWSAKVEVVEGAAVTLRVPELPDVPVLPPFPIPQATTVAITGPEIQTIPDAPHTKVKDPHAHLGPWRAAGLVAAGIGILGVGVGGAFGIDALSKKNAAAGSGCSGSQCTSTAGATRDEARSEANVSTGFFVAGGALSAAGGSLWLFAPSARTPAVLASVTSRGVLVQGAW